MIRTAEGEFRVRPWHVGSGIVAVLAAVAVGLGLAYWWADGLMKRWALAQLRADAAVAAEPYASSLSNAVSERLALVRAFAAYVGMEIEGGDLDEEFAPFAEGLQGILPGILNIEAAPGFVVRHVYPVAGNEAILGHDLLADPRPGFADAVRRGVETRDVTSRGPTELIRGGIGLIVWHAVFEDGKPWGSIAFVFDLQPILEQAGLESLGQHHDYAVRRDDGGAVAGDQGVFASDPIVQRIRLPDADWELAVAPKKGWAVAASQAAASPLLPAVFAGLYLALAAIVLLVADRRRALTDLVAARTRDLLAARLDADRRADELAVAKRELEQFAYAAAHDLQEPVRVMGTYAQIVARQLGEAADPETREGLEHLTTGAVRLRTLLRDVQLFVAEDRVPTPVVASPAEAALDTALAALARPIAEAGAVILREPLPPVMADRRRLKEILVELIGNAVKYRHPDRTPEIRIAWQRIGTTDVVSVSDNGIGIDPRYHERIFDVFRRLHARDTHPGTGMGLAIARKMALRLGGRITVESAPDAGSTFSLHLPAADAAPAQGKAA